MIEAKLGVTTCDKCQKLMTESQPVLIITEGNISESNDVLTFDGSCVRYACHRDCWDGIEEIAAGAPRKNYINKEENTL